MAIKDAISRITGLLAGKSKSEEMPDIDDDKTTDRHLKSLRRERRIMDEREEKKKLKEEIDDDNKDQNSKMFFTDEEHDITKARYDTGENYNYLAKAKELKGILKDKKIGMLKEKIIKQREILKDQQQHSFFTGKPTKKRTIRKNNPKKQQTWLGKSGL